MSLADQLLLIARCLVKEHCNLFILHAAPPWPVSSTMARVVTGLSPDAVFTSPPMARVGTGLSPDDQPWLCLHTGPIGEACKYIKLHIEIFKI